MASRVETPVRTYLRAARPIDQQLNLFLARRAADLRGNLHGETVRWKRRRIIRRHLKRLYRDVKPIIFAGEQIAVEAAVQSMMRHGAVSDPAQARMRALILNGSEDRLARLEELVEGNHRRALALMDRDLDVADLLNPYRKGGISYQIMRLIRAETNSTFHSAEQIVADLALSWDWNRSQTHTVRDICDDLAARGPYPTASVPNKPHPWCLCYVTPNVR